MKILRPQAILLSTVAATCILVNACMSAPQSGTVLKAGTVGGAPTTPTTPKLRVLTTVEPLVNIIYNIGGDRIDLDGVIPPGTDSHTFEPAPSDAIKMSAADVILVNGLSLEEPTVNLARKNLKSGAEIVEMGELTVKPENYVYDFSFPKSEGKPNPHLWMNPLNALRYAEIARDTLTRRDPANATYYQSNLAKFALKIEALDRAIKTTINSIPEKNRRLLTYHDSFAYFAPRYGMIVLGAIQPSSFKEPSAQEIVQLIKQVRAENVPAIFGSEVFPSKVLEQIKKDSGAEFIDTLADDALPGELTDSNHTYFGMLARDVATMARVLGGKPELIAGLDVTNSLSK